MLSLVLALALTQAGAPASTVSPPVAKPAALADRPIAVLLTRRAGLTAPRALEIASEVAQGLANDGLAISLEPVAASERLGQSAVGDTARCEGRVDCIAGLGKLLGVQRVVGVDLAQVANETALHLVALDLTGAAPRQLAQDSLIVGPGAPNLEYGLRPFAVKLAQALAPGATLAAPPKLTPTAPPGSAAQRAIAFQPPSRLPRYLAAGGTAVAAGLTAYFLISAGHLASKLNDSRTQSGAGVTASRLTQAEADTTASSQHRDVALGIGGVVVTAGLGALTAWLWTRPEAAR